MAECVQSLPLVKECARKHPASLQGATIVQTLFLAKLATSCARAAFRRLTLSLSFILAAFGLMLPSHAFAANVEITNPAGPLNIIGITDTGNLYANRGAGAFNNLYYNDTAAGWFVYDATNNVMYTPPNVPAGSVTGTGWMPVSQTPQTGTGTTADPYKITATVEGGGMTAVITVTYVAGADVYGTSIQVKDTSGAARDLRVFLGADLYFSGNDAGIPRYDPATGSVGGEGVTTGGVSTGLSGWFVPTTPADHHFAGNYYIGWQLINAHQLDDSVGCTSGTSCDNGAALQWNVTLPANGTANIVVGQLFNDNLVLLPPTLPSGGTVGTPYTQTFAPFGGIDPYTVTLASPAATLPPGLTFNPATLTLSGTPTTAGTYTFTLHVKDTTPGTNLQADFPYTLVIGTGGTVPVSTTGSVPVPTLGEWALMALALLLGLAAFGMTRQKA